MSGEPSFERGIDFSTFSIIGRCERTGMFGVAIATSEMAVAPGASTSPRGGRGAVPGEHESAPRLPWAEPAASRLVGAAGGPGAGGE